MQRTITEGSTIVVKAIYTNSVEQLREAFQCAPHGERAHWMLKVQVGTQSITPLYWSVRSGALESASVIICDCPTFRADRGKYYYAADELFERHSDIVKMLCDEAPGLLPTLLSGLIWRSRLTEDGSRRGTYHVERLLVSRDGQFSKALQWMLTIPQDFSRRPLRHPPARPVTNSRGRGGKVTAVLPSSVSED